MKPDVMQYPVICLSQGWIQSEISEQSLTRCGIKAFKNGWYKKMIIIDSDGVEYVVKDVYQVGYDGPFWGFRFLKQRQIKVDLEIEMSKKLDIDTFQNMIYDYIKKKASFWSSGGSITEIKRQIKESKTFRDIIDLPIFRDDIF